MKKIFIATLAFITISLHGAVLVQTGNFSGSAFYSTPGTYSPIPEESLSEIFQPFNTSLGTLDSFTITWNIDFTADLVVGDPGYADFGGGLTAFLNDTDFNGSGIGTGRSVPGETNLEITRTITSTYLNQPDAAGYNAAAVLTIVNGNDPFTAYLANTIEAELRDTATVDITFEGDVTLTYTYTAVPEPSHYTLMLGFVVFMVLGCARFKCRQ